jgi:hypothetical protein
MIKMVEIQTDKEIHLAKVTGIKFRPSNVNGSTEVIPVFGINGREVVANSQASLAVAQNYVNSLLEINEITHLTKVNADLEHVALDAVTDIEYEEVSGQVRPVFYVDNFFVKGNFQSPDVVNNKTSIEVAKADTKLFFVQAN